MSPLPQIDPSTMLDIDEAMLEQVSKACSLNAVERARLIGAKQCIACGSYQDVRGVLPCGHDNDL